MEPITRPTKRPIRKSGPIDSSKHPVISRETEEMYKSMGDLFQAIDFSLFHEPWIEYIDSVSPDQLSVDGFIEFIRSRLTKTYKTKQALEGTIQDARIFAGNAQTSLKVVFEARQKAVNLKSEIGGEIVTLFDSVFMIPATYKYLEIRIRVLEQFINGEKTPQEFLKYLNSTLDFYKDMENIQS